MSSWYLAPALADLRAELDALAPDRDRRSDGTIADSAHASTSKHQPNAAGVVRAFDCDNSGPWPAGITFDRIVATLVDRHRRGLDDRLQNIIWDRHIWSRSWDWQQQPYTGASAHTEHGHIEVRDSATYWTKRGPFGLLELAEANVSWTDDVITNPAWRADADTNPTVQAKFALYDAWNQAHAANVATAAILAQLKALTGKDFVDEAAIVAGVLAGLDPAAIVAGIPADMAEQVVRLLAARMAT